MFSFCPLMTPHSGRDVCCLCFFFSFFFPPNKTLVVIIITDASAVHAVLRDQVLPVLDVMCRVRLDIFVGTSQLSYFSKKSCFGHNTINAIKTVTAINKILEISPWVCGTSKYGCIPGPPGFTCFWCASTTSSDAFCCGHGYALYLPSCRSVRSLKNKSGERF